MIPRLKNLYKEKIIPNLTKKFELANILMTPKLEKIILNMGLGLDASDKKILESCVQDMALISGNIICSLIPKL